MRHIPRDWKDETRSRNFRHTDGRDTIVLFEDENSPFFLEKVNWGDITKRDEERTGYISFRFQNLDKVCDFESASGVRIEVAIKELVEGVQTIEERIEILGSILDYTEITNSSVTYEDERKSLVEYIIKRNGFTPTMDKFAIAISDAVCEVKHYKEI